MNRRDRDRFVRALQITGANPFAQLSRFADTSKKYPPSKPYIAPTPSSKPQSTTPVKRQKTGPDSYVTPQKASKDTPKISPVELKRKMLTRIEESEDMDVEASGTTARAAGPTATTTKGMGQETPITFMTPSHGLPNTVTQVLNQTTYFSVVTRQVPTDPVYFTLRLNTPKDWFKGSSPGLATPVGNNTTPLPYEPGFWSAPLISGTSASWSATNAAREFPNTLSSNERPQWRDWFETQYQYYAVLGCEYEVTMVNPQLNSMSDIVVAHFFDSYSSENATSVHPKNATFSIMEQWPDVSFKRISSANDGSIEKAYGNVKDFYKPGSMKKNVENDEDVKTWTKVDTVPTLSEEVTFLFAKAWDNQVAPATGLNVRIDMRWIVQYKDLKPTYRWPANQSAIVLEAPSGIKYTS